MDIEKNTAIESDTNSDYSGQGSQKMKVGVTFLLRTQDGLTATLRSAIRVLVLIEASYGHHEDLSKYSLLVCIAGGVGITAVLPYCRSHPGQRKLFWGARSTALVESMQSALTGVEIKSFVGKRMDIPDILGQETRHTAETIVVVVSGPAEMVDEARIAISQKGKG